MKWTHEVGSKIKYQGTEWTVKTQALIDDGEQIYFCTSDTKTRWIREDDIEE